MIHQASCSVLTLNFPFNKKNVFKFQVLEYFDRYIKKIVYCIKIIEIFCTILK